MNNQILSLLKERFAGVDDKILERFSEKMKKSIKDDDVAAAVDAVTIQQIIDSYGDYRATAAQRTAVANYESKWHLKDGKTVADGGETDEKDNLSSLADKGGIPAWATALIDSNKQLSERLATMQRERTTQSRRAQLDEVLKPLPRAIAKAYTRTPVDDLTDGDFDNLITSIRGEVTDIADGIRAKGAILSEPYQGTGSPAAELSDDQLARISARQGHPDKGEQPF